MGLSPVAVAVLGSLGFRGFFSLGFSSTTGLPSGPTSFFFRTRLGFSGAVPFVPEFGLVVVELFVAFVPALGAAELWAGAAAATPSPESPGMVYGGWATRIVSETPLCCGGEFGGEEIDEELSCEAPSSACALWPNLVDISVQVSAQIHAKMAM